MNRAKKNLSQFTRVIVRFIFVLTVNLIIFLPASAQNESLNLQGEVRDERGAVIVNAEITLSDKNETKRETASNKQGIFYFDRLENEIYKLQVSAEGFGIYEENLDLSAAVKSPSLSIVLYPTFRADVEVNENTEAALDAERAAGTQILNEKELADLPDDPDQLNQQLQNLAASSGGAPGGATVAVDGFLTGKLPPKSAIRSVRINPNLYSAEFETPPFQGGRIEVTTKPGSEKPSGSAFFNYNGTALNARDPFSIERADTQTNRYGLSFGAPIVKNRAGFFLDYERRNITEAAVVNAVILDGNFQTANYIFNAPNPKRLTIGSARADWQINRTNTLVFRYDFNQNKLFGQGIGGTNLPERGFDSRQTENIFRLTETVAVNARTVNELRIGFTRNEIEQHAASNDAAIVVAGSFASGGASLQKLVRDEKRLELTNYLTTDIGKHNLKFGVQIYNRRVGELRAENTNGSFFFGGAVENAGAISGLEQYRRALLGLQPDGTPTRFSITFGAPQVFVNQWLFAGFVQDEWKFSPKVLFSLGLRYEGQTAPTDAVSFAPRLGVAYTPDKKQNWVFRARAGLYYSRFDDALVLETERLDGRRQQQIIVDSPSFPNPLAGGNINNAIPTIRIFDSNLTPPASLQMRLEMERQLPRGWKISSNYSFTFNWNRLRSRNINAPLVSPTNPDPRTAPRPFGDSGNILQFESSGRATGRVLYIGVNQNTNKYFSVNAGYLNFDFHTDADAPFSLPQSSYDFTGEWARPFWQTRHRVFITTTVNLPYKLRLWASLNATSGAAFNITTGRDNNGDGNFNDRPDESFAANLSTVQTIFGFLNPSVINGNFRRNAGTNPATATLDFNLSRQFNVGKKTKDGDSRYRLTANIRAANALNRANLIGTSGILSSPLFGRATTANPARRIEFGLRLNF